MSKGRGAKNQKGQKQKAKSLIEIAYESFEPGYNSVSQNFVFITLLHNARYRWDDGGSYPSKGLAFVTKDGVIHCNYKIQANPGEWARAIAHCLLHLGMGHFVEHDRPIEWNMACDFVVERFLSDLGFGQTWYAGALPQGMNDEEKLYEYLCCLEDKSEYVGLGTAGLNVCDMVFNELPEDANLIRRYTPKGGVNKPPDWKKMFAMGLSRAVISAVRAASDVQWEYRKGGSAEEARQWFVSNYPLLGAVAAGFKVIQDPKVCQRMQVSIAAVSPLMSEIYISPAAALSKDELRFVMAHEFLHAALCHDTRREWRDAYLWNIACDFVINMWLSEMGIGERPSGLLYDEQFKGMNAEAVYDRIVGDMRVYRKLATLRGVGLGDILSEAEIGDDNSSGERGRKGGDGDVDLDEFYRRALSQGLEYHITTGRGYLPEGLIEEIRALSHPPIPWDVELARWFDEMFVPLEKTRSYARPSRRQSSTPDIPRPNWVINREALDSRTFGVVLDTSGSMDRSLLAASLGAIASYSAARDVPAARVVFCDADAYDAGYMKPEDIAGTVKVKGRGGTVLQPGIDLLLKAEDFPKDAPVLVITDGYCDKVVLFGREHAFLIPHKARLPFTPKGKVFRMQ